ncbi:50S ribosomal protein L6 [Blattabacterium cuenoti]|uniref:50S ribosomal protein L6 n=1 Tax=Blattabacterium cuenoti TaxID=1653831 RepID=UPI00163C196C|nr:50S ribosomal protein L6 [Blattabacterium cuenoti]
MSRIGNKPILIPDEINLEKNNNIIVIKGKLGVIKEEIDEKLNLIIKDNYLYISRKNNDKISKSIHGLYRVLINNMIIGVTLGFIKELELVGVGYRAEYFLSNRILNMNLGFSHDIMIQVPQEIELNIKSKKGKNTILILKSYNKQLLGIFSAKIRSFRVPEPYKGKGIRYLGEEIRRKAGKSA